MRLTFEPFDGRGRHFKEIVDEDTGEKVGTFQSYGVGTYRNGGLRVSLFGERYTLESKTYIECCGFIKGVEAVLSEMASTEIKRPFEASWDDHQVVKKAS